MRECWKDVVGYKGYYMVSNMGRVRSKDRTVETKDGKSWPMKGRILTPHINGQGYLHVGLSVNGVLKTKKVHRLVASAFLDREKHHQCVNHLDGSKINNEAANLEWCTLSENTKHAVKEGLKPTGQDSHLSKLTNFQVRLILVALRHCSMTQEEIGRLFNVSGKTISAINTGVSWKEVSR